MKQWRAVRSDSTAIARCQSMVDGEFSSAAQARATRDNFTFMKFGWTRSAAR